MTTLTAYRCTVLRAYAAYELTDGRPGLSWVDGTVSTDRYEVECEPVSIQVLEGAELRQSCGGDLLLFTTDRKAGLSADEAVSLGIAKVGG